MNPVELEIGFSTLTLKLADSKWEPYALSLAGKVDTKVFGAYTYSLSAQNLEKIFKIFDGKALPKPVVTKGQNFLDAMRDKYRNYVHAKRRMQDIMKLESYPVEPNGKFAPRAHQTKIIGSVMSDCFTPVFADCGTGKTGSVGRSIELVLQAGEITRGKVLISAPLSILSTSWEDDLKKFTDLKYKVLWAPITNKTIRSGEKVVIGMGVPEKPEGTLTVKSRKGVRWVKGTAMKQTLDLFDEAEGGWSKMEVSWKEAIVPGQDPIAFGPIYGQAVSKENTREKFVQECLQDKSVDVFIINHDGVRNYEDILKAHNFEWVVVDESTKIKSPHSKVGRAHIGISWNAKRRTIMTGTPNPNGFEDLWNQFYFLDRGLTLSTTLADYRHSYFTPVKVGHFGGQDAVKWEIRDISQRDALVQKVRESSVFFSQEDCIDLPPRTDMNREIIMTAEQSRIYREMEKDLVAELLDRRTGNNLQVEAVNTLAKLMKLRQITSGFVGHVDGVAAIESADKNPKYSELDDFIEELQGKKLVVACQFKEEIRTVLERYKHLGAAAIYGDEPVAARNESIRTFQTTDKLQIMVLQPAAAAHGITLTEAHYFVFLSLDYNFEFYYQTGKRIQRLGQKNPMFVYHFLAKTDDGRQTIDHDLVDVLRSKSSDRNVLFDGGRDTVEIAEILTNRLIQRVQQNH